MNVVCYRGRVEVFLNIPKTERPVLANPNLSVGDDSSCHFQIRRTVIQESGTCFESTQDKRSFLTKTRPGLSQERWFVWAGILEEILRIPMDIQRISAVRNWASYFFPREILSKLNYVCYFLGQMIHNSNIHAFANILQNFGCCVTSTFRNQTSIWI